MSLSSRWLFELAFRCDSALGGRGRDRPVRLEGSAHCGVVGLLIHHRKVLVVRVPEDCPQCAPSLTASEHLRHELARLVCRATGPRAVTGRPASPQRTSVLLWHQRRPVTVISAAIYPGGAWTGCHGLCAGSRTGYRGRPRRARRARGGPASLARCIVSREPLDLVQMGNRLVSG